MQDPPEQEFFAIAVAHRPVQPAICHDFAGQQFWLMNVWYQTMIGQAELMRRVVGQNRQTLILRVCRRILTKRFLGVCRRNVLHPTLRVYRRILAKRFVGVCRRNVLHLILLVCRRIGGVPDHLNAILEAVHRRGVLSGIPVDHCGGEP